MSRLLLARQLVASKSTGSLLQASRCLSWTPADVRNRLEVTNESVTLIVTNPTADNSDGATPLAHFLTSLLGCSQHALQHTAQEQTVRVDQVRWSAEGTFQTPVQRDEPPSRFKSISVVAEVDSDATQQTLDSMTDKVEQRCIIANTVRASGIQFQMALRKKFVFKSSMGSYV